METDDEAGKVETLVRSFRRVPAKDQPGEIAALRKVVAERKAKLAKLLAQYQEFASWITATDRLKCHEGLAEATRRLLFMRQLLAAVEQSANLPMPSPQKAKQEKTTATSQLEGQAVAVEQVGLGSLDLQPAATSAAPQHYDMAADDWIEEDEEYFPACGDAVAVKPATEDDNFPDDDTCMLLQHTEHDANKMWPGGGAATDVGSCMLPQRREHDANKMWPGRGAAMEEPATTQNRSTAWADMLDTDDEQQLAGKCLSHLPRERDVTEKDGRQKTRKKNKRQWQRFDNGGDLAAGSCGADRDAHHGADPGPKPAVLAGMAWGAVQTMEICGCKMRDTNFDARRCTGRVKGKSAHFQCITGEAVAAGRSNCIQH